MQPAARYSARRLGSIQGHGSVRGAGRFGRPSSPLSGIVSTIRPRPRKRSRPSAMSLTIISDAPSRGNDHVGVISNVTAAESLPANFTSEPPRPIIAKTFQWLRAASARLHERASRMCANASRTITTLKSLQRQVLRATIVVTSSATVTQRNYSRIGCVVLELGVLRSSTRAAGWGEHGGFKWAGGGAQATQAVASLLFVSGIAGPAARTRAQRKLRSPGVLAQFRSIPIAGTRWRKVRAPARPTMSALAMPSRDQNDNHHSWARTGGSSR